jgi:parallel beta-helix repeat protein
MRYICTSIVATLVLAGTSFAATINVPADYPTIQGAIDASENGDVILVAPGTYTGTGDQVVDMLGKAITLRASGTPEETILDGQGARRVLMCNSGETPATIIEGFTITDGHNDTGPGGPGGGGIYCGGTIGNRSSPTITGCTISGNTATGNGAGIYCYESDPTITDCTITGNTTMAAGGGIYCASSSINISGCTISGNTAAELEESLGVGGGGGIYVGWGGRVLISGGSVCGNSSNQINAGTAHDLITCAMCWIAASCDDNPYLIIANQQEQIDQLLNMHAQQQSAIDELQLVVVECCAERTCAGDENKDGVVNIYDLLLLLESWGPCP